MISSQKYHLARLGRIILFFFEKPSSYHSLGIFRIFIGFFCLIEIVLLYPNRFEFIGDEGWIKWEICKATNNTWLPHVQILVDYLSIPENTAVNLFFIVFCILCITFISGLWSRISSLLLFMCHLTLTSSMSFFIYGKDILLQVALFYCVFMPVGKAFSIDNLIGKLKSKVLFNFSPYARISLRVLQIHLCLIYFTAGIEKAFLIEWWNGNAIWYALTQNDFNVINFNFLKSVPLIPMLMGITTVILEISYAFIMWIPKVRFICFMMIISMHIFIGLFMKMPMFGLLMIIFSFVAWRNEIFNDYIAFKK